MDFKAVLTCIADRFGKARIRYAVIGGVAVGLRAQPRFTHDLDLIVHRDDFSAAKVALMEIGYAEHWTMPTFTRFTGALKVQGVIDLQRATPVAGPRMLKRASRVREPLTRRWIPVVSPEDLIGLKIIAAANNPRRRRQDEADIEAIARANRRRLNWKLLGEYYAIVEQPDGAKRLKREIRGKT